MTDQSWIDDLRRRVERDPASIAFAQLAEEYRRAGQLEEAVQTCQAGLATHPEYISARVTLGRALLALGRLHDAEIELSRAVGEAPGSVGVAAVRALAETYRRQGRQQEALAHYSTARTLSPNDPDIDRMVRDLGAVIAEADRQAAEVERKRALATIAALNRWLEAIDATRAQRRS